MKSKIIRHIELPINFQCLTGFDGSNPYWTFNIRFPAIRLDQNKLFEIKNFSFNPMVLNSYVSIGTSANLIELQPPIIQIFGLTNQGIEKIISDYSNPSYVYNSVLNNPDTKINTGEILPYIDRAINTNNDLSITDLLNYPSSASDLISQKSPGYINKISGSTTELNYFSNQYFTNFYFINTNYKTMLFYMSLPRLSLSSNTPIGIDTSVKGFISCDLIQTDSAN